MTSMPMLALPDFSKPFVVELDASGHGVRAVMQDQRPIGYFSWVLPQQAQLMFVYERELMAIVWAVQKWRHYLLGQKFLVRIDQRSLKFLLEQREVSLEHSKWLTKLLGFHFDIQYKYSLENTTADALSRVGGPSQFMALLVPHTFLLEEVVDQVARDEKLGGILDDLLH